MRFSTSKMILGVLIFTICPGFGTVASAETLAAPDATRSQSSSSTPSTEIFYDDFQRGLAPIYQMTEGPGEIKAITQGGTHFLRYYSEPRGVEFASDESPITIDGLGRPYAPSETLQLPFFGKSWVLDIKIAYHFERPSNGRSISVWLVFDKPEVRQNWVRVSRYNDNPGQPGKRGILGLEFGENGIRKAPSLISLNDQDVYFLRFRRRGTLLIVSLSNDGRQFNEAGRFQFSNSVLSNLQWFLLNGMAFGPGATADLSVISIRGSDTKIGSFSESAPFVAVGRKVDPKDILKAVAEEKPVVLKFAEITGRVDLSNTKVVNNFSAVNCHFNGPVNFSGTQFLAKADFSGSVFPADTRFILTRFERGGDFSGTGFSTKVWFRSARFDGPSSFYFATLGGGADLSSAHFGSDVSFSDLELPDGKDLTFYGSTFKGKTLLLATLQRSVPRVLGKEISFEQSRLKSLALSSGDTNPWSKGSEQTGPGLWSLPASLTLRGATIETLTLKDIHFSQGTTVDFRGVRFIGGVDSVRLLNVDFNHFLIDDWPSGKVLADGSTENGLVHLLDQELDVNPAVGRVSYFDLGGVSPYYDRWINADSHLRPNSYRDYLGYKLRSIALGAFRLVSNYGTNLPRALFTGLVMVAVFGLVFFVLDPKGSCIVRIESPFELKTRLSVLPVLTFGEKPLSDQSRSGPPVEVLEAGVETAEAASAGGSRLARVRDDVIGAVKGLLLALEFSMNIVGKIGLGNLRVHARESLPRRLVVAAWIGWVFGFLGYLLIVYTVSIVPALKGLW